MHEAERKPFSLYYTYSKIFPALTWGAAFFTKSYVKSCNPLHVTFFCLWANSHTFSLNSIQISFARMCIMCKQAKTEAVLVLPRCRRVCVCKYIHFYISHINMVQTPMLEGTTRNFLMGKGENPSSLLLMQASFNRSLQTTQLSNRRRLFGIYSCFPGKTSIRDTAP